MLNKISDINEIQNIGLQIIQKKTFQDERGSLSVNFELEISNPNVIYKESLSKKNVFRGLHFQMPPYLQDKIISVEKGELIDFVMNLDHQSTNFGKIFYFTLHERNDFRVFIPGSFAHGFLTLTDVKFNYFCIGSYNKQSELSIKIDNIDLQSITNSSIFRSELDMCGISPLDAINKLKF